MSFPDTVVQLRAGRETCTGFLIDPHTVITAAHFLRGKDGSIAVKALGKTIYSKQYVKIRSTDVAVVRLPHAVDCERFYPIATTYPSLFSQSHTIGYGGKRTPRTLRGRYLIPMFFNVNTTFETRIRHAGVVFSYPPAIPGDSGGPVFVNGQIVGIQSLVFNLKRWNLGIATISMLPKFREDIGSAIRSLGGNENNDQAG